MPSRRYHGIMQGGAEDTRVFHREHRSKKGRQNILDRKKSIKVKKWLEDWKAREMDKSIKKLLR